MLLLLIGTLPAFLHPEAMGKSSQRTLTFKERVAYQRAIEEVYWRHRIWPKERPGSKPSLETVMSQAQIETKVTDYLRKSQALRDYWQRPITAEQLQAEIDRMAKHTRQPDMLRELFEALGNDPFVIAECLARPALADRLLRNWYARDQRIHGDVRRHGEVWLVTHPAWHKEPLEAWLARAEKQSAMTVAAGVSYSLPKISDTADSCIDNTWTALPGPPDGRVEQTSVWTGTEMIVWGGQGSVYVSTGGRYNPIIDNWTPTSNTNAPSARHAHTAIWTGTEMIVWGGQDNKQNIVNTGARYDPNTDSWTATSTSNAPAIRGSHTAVWTGSQMIVWGGSSSSGYLNTGGRYNPSTDSWTATSTTNAPAGRIVHRAVWTGSEMIVWGGYFYDGSGHYLNTGGRYNPSTDSWTATSTTNVPTGRYSHTAVWTGTEMVVWGGTDFQSYFNTGGRYNPSSDSWALTSTTNAPSGRASHTAVWTGSEMIVWGGGFSNTGARYNPGTDNWVSTSTTNAPSERGAHAAIWTGSEMIVWGGRDPGGSNEFLTTGGRYNPGTDSWTTMSTANTPAARFLHTAVWTGTEMIVWGGQVGYPSYLNTGGRYTPSIDNWTATSTIDAPSARNFHTAIWTGTEMIVWGGNEFGFPSNAGAKNNAQPAPTTPTPTPTPPIPATGGRYDPGTDTWRATSSINAPSLREHHTAVWTGTEMIVWGGSWTDMFGPHYYNSGGRYDPITDSWLGTGGPAVPASRDSHSAVWTGSEMIVWGGYYWDGFDHYLNTGGRYNPTTGSWTPTSEINVPTARSSNIAVWTDNEMIIWGGYDGTSFLNTGGMYNPGINSWTGTSTANAPTGRVGHTAVWTDSEMIIWGGYDGTSYLDTGSRYNPSTNGWTATSTTAAPAARSLHTAIWTGSEMIIWAGRLLGAQNTHTGGRYCAQTGSTPTPTPEARVTPKPRLHPTPPPRP